GVEQRIEIAEAQSDQELPLVNHPAGIPAGWEDHMNLMLDLQVLAFQCDLTRVITFMVGHEHSGMTYPQIGVPDAHHPISHHQQEPEKVAKVAKINAYHVQMLARMLGKLKATPDGDGTLLDHVTMMYGAGIADSNSHSPVDIPMILAGGGTPQGVPYENGHGRRDAGRRSSDTRSDTRSVRLQPDLRGVGCSRRSAADTGGQEQGRRWCARAAEAARRRECAGRRRRDGAP